MTRAARRPVSRRPYQKTFLERYGSWLIIAFVIAGVGLIAYVALTSAASPAYACDARLTPGPTEANPTPIPPTPSPSPSPTASPSAAPTASSAASPSTGASGSPAASASAAASASPSASPTASASAGASPTAEPTAVPSPTARLGFTTTDLGRNHTTGSVRYAFCPPTSGDHYIINGQAPMQPSVYGPDKERAPEYWVHNLEHGYVVLAYRCPSGVLGSGDCITSADMTNIQNWYNNAPPPPASTCAKKVLAVRFDAMNTKFALIAWDRALLTDTFDPNQATLFAQQWEDAPTTPERGAC